MVHTLLGKDEIQEFIVPINNMENQNFFWDFKTFKDTGNFELMLKICENDLNCRILQEDFERAKNSKENSSAKNDDLKPKVFYKNTTN